MLWIIWIYLFLSKCSYIFIKDVSTFLSLYRNVSTFLGLAISLTVFFQNLDASLYKDVSTFSLLYRKECIQILARAFIVFF